MTTLPSPDAAALATELAHLIDLPLAKRGPEQGARYDQVRWSIGDTHPADRMTCYAAAVTAIDPSHTLGPYPDFNTDLTLELYAYENWRLGCIYNSVDPHDAVRADVSRRLLVVTEPLLHSYSSRDRHAYSHVTMLLTFRDVGPENFPEFGLREYLSDHGVDLEAWDAAAENYCKIEELFRKKALEHDDTNGHDHK